MPIYHNRQQAFCCEVGRYRNSILLWLYLLSDFGHCDIVCFSCLCGPCGMKLLLLLFIIIITCIIYCYYYYYYYYKPFVVKLGAIEILCYYDYIYYLTLAIVTLFALVVYVVPVEWNYYYYYLLLLLHVLFIIIIIIISLLLWSWAL